MLTNSYLIALGIPLILVACGAIAKKLVRGSAWQASDFYLGVELALSSLGSALVHFFDLQKKSIAGSTPAIGPNDITSTASYLAIAFFLLLWILSTHQDWEKRPQNLTGQKIWLLGITNTVGILLFAAFVMLVKGV